jgi:polysaccharide export outer membrane protein
LTNIDDIPTAALASVTTQAGDFTIKPGDMLQISVSASNSDAVKPFNKIQYVLNTMSGSSGSYTMMIGDNSTVFYLVDDNGNIDFPVLGKLHVAGMTKKSIEEYVVSLIYPRYLTEMPSVDCRIQNFRVFCLGEFSHTGVVKAENGRLNLIEAIAMSGDLTLQGRRDNILLIRTDPTGQRIVKRFNLQDAKIMTMPEFELQQNDILYVQPSVYKARSAWSMPPIYTTAVGMMGTAMSLITFITVLAKK